MAFSLMSKWTEVYVVFALFTLMSFTFFWAGVEEIRKARLLHLRWMGYAQGVKSMSYAVFWAMLLVIALIQVSANGLPESYNGVSLLTWVLLLLFTLGESSSALITHLSVRNISHMNQGDRDALSQLKRAMFQLNRTLEGGGSERPC